MVRTTAVPHVNIPSVPSPSPSCKHVAQKQAHVWEVAVDLIHIPVLIRKPEESVRVGYPLGGSLYWPPAFL